MATIRLLSHDDQNRAPNPAPGSRAQKTSRRRLIVLIASFSVLGALALSCSNDAPHLDGPTVLLSMGCSFVLLRSAWAWANEPASPAVERVYLWRRMSVRTLMVVVVAAALVSLLVTRSQKLQARARQYEAMKARCQSTTIERYLRSTPINMRILADDCAALNQSCASAAWRPWIAVERINEHLEGSVAHRSDALLRLEDKAARVASFPDEVRRRLASRGRRLGPLTGGHSIRGYTLHVNADDTFIFWEPGKYNPEYVSSGFAELVDGKLRLDLVDGWVRRGSPEALALDELVAWFEELAKLRGLAAPNK